MCLYPKERFVDCKDGIRRKMITSCGKCVECLNAYANEVSLRMWHESHYFSNCYFVTFTYDDEHLRYSSDGFPTLYKRDVQLFIKSLRNKGFVFRYRLVGEYGGQTLRPHYHAIFFTNDIIAFDDWRFGFVDVQEGRDIAMFKYVAKYMSKMQGRAIFGRLAPFTLCSSRPFLGLRLDDLERWFNNAQNTGDYRFYVNGRAYNCPRIYREKLSNYPLNYDQTRLQRFFTDEGSRELAQREKALNYKLSLPKVRN